MKEKFIEIERFFAYGNIIGMAAIAYVLSQTYLSYTLNISFFIEVILSELVLTFLSAGFLYGIRKVKFKFTLNLISLIFNWYFNGLKIIFYLLIYPFKFFIFLIGMGIENLHEKKMCG